MLGGDVVTLNKAAVFADKNVGTGKTVDLTGSTLSGAGAGNYALSLTGAPTTTADITAASLTITADDKSKAFNAPLPALTAYYSGLQGTDTASVISGLSLLTTATATSSAGTYAITPNGATAANYTIIYVDGTLTVLPRSGTGGGGGGGGGGNVISTALQTQDPLAWAVAPEAPEGDTLIGAGADAVPAAGVLAGEEAKPCVSVVSAVYPENAVDVALSFSNAFLDGIMSLPGSPLPQTPEGRHLACANSPFLIYEECVCRDHRVR